jgi:hypothetical protein
MSTLRNLSHALGIRFSIDIRPVGSGVTGFPEAGKDGDMFITDGVEMLVLAS